MSQGESQPELRVKAGRQHWSGLRERLVMPRGTLSMQSGPGSGQFAVERPPGDSERTLSCVKLVGVQ